MEIPRMKFTAFFRLIALVTAIITLIPLALSSCNKHPEEEDEEEEEILNDCHHADFNKNGLCDFCGAKTDGKESESVDFLRDDLSEYVSIPESVYESFVSSTVNTLPLELEINNKIIQLLYTNRLTYDGMQKTDAVITAGDVTSIYYMGYTLENGVKSYIDGGCNLYGTPSSLGIGSGQFIPGFEYNMIGKNPTDYVAVKQTSSIGEKTRFLVISYNLNSDRGTSTQNAVINLQDTDIDQKYGEGFRAFITADGVTVGSAIQGSFTSGAVTYSNITVTKAFDINDSNLHTLTVETYFPIDYSEKSLQGRLVYFDVFVESVTEYDVPELNDAFVTEYVKMSTEDLADYEGESLLEKYYAYVKEEVEKSRDELMRSAIEAEIYNHIFNNAIYIKLPEGEVDRIYESDANQMLNAYNQYSAYFPSLDSFAVAYLGLNEGENWQTCLKENAEKIVKQELSLSFAIRDRGFAPSDDELEALYPEFIDEQFEYYIGDTLTPGTQEYKDARAKYQTELEEYYGKDYLITSIYYEYGMEKLYDLMYK